MRSISRVIGVSINTVTKLLVDAGEACAAYHHEHVRDVKSQRIQCDEIWSFCYTKQKNVATAKAAPEDAGDVWTWTGLDADSRLIVSYKVGGRDAEYAIEFMDDVDYAQLVKLYGSAPENMKGKYSPAECTGTRKRYIEGKPSKEDVSTSYVERQNLTMRMHMRRFTRLTNAFSKKIDNHIHMLSLYFVHYNFCRQHKSLDGLSPAMVAGVSDTLHDMEWIVGLIDARAPKPGPRGKYKKSNSN